MAIQRDITTADNFFIGEDKTFTDTIYQADGVTPQNVGAWNISFLIKKNPTDTDLGAKVTKTVANGGIVLTTPASGLITISIVDTDTALLPAGIYRYEVKRTDDGSETVLTYGACVLRQAVHR